MKYEEAPDITEKMRIIVKMLEMNHVQFENISCIRSHGSNSTAIARCHALNKIMQKALKRKGFYILEFISEKFDRLSDDEKIKIIIHELMHIPKTFGGGFRHHDFVTNRNVEKLYKEYQSRRDMSLGDFSL